MVQNKEEMTWDKVEKEIAKEIKKSNRENFTTEIFRELKSQSRFTITALSIVLTIGLFLYCKNEIGWRKNT